jgi:N-acetylglucosaminyldiphosphoundecaprenol N-acetyl-beta-D-mannosaminyltransferase
MPPYFPGFIPPRRYEFLGMQVDALTVESLFQVSAAAVTQNRQIVIANHNMHSLYLQRRSQSMRRFYEEADYVHADGMWIVYLARLFKQPLLRENRITSLDWLDGFLRMAQRNSWRVFFLGGTPAVCERFEHYIRSTYAMLSSGHHNGYFETRPGSADNEEVLSAIGRFSPHILVVCMGMPRQEEWIHDNRGRLTANVIFPLGGILDYLVGETATPPRWTGPMGVEWAYRLLHDPRRLAGRYLGEPICLAPWIIAEALRALRLRGFLASTFTED